MAPEPGLVELEEEEVDVLEGFSTAVVVLGWATAT
jgi:hypothetical protein